MSIDLDVEKYYQRIDRNLYVIFSGIEPCIEYINTYLIVSSTNKGVIIDPGPHNSADRVHEVLKALGLEKSIELIIPTHIHLDHAGASAKLARLTGAAVMTHPRGIPHIRDPSKLWEASREVQGEIVDHYGRPEDGFNIEILEAKDLLDVVIDDVTLGIIHTPGHASHHISILWRDRGILFSGDSAGIYIPELDIVLPTTPPPFRYEQYIESLKKMISMKPDYIAFTHRGVRRNHDFLEKHYEQIKSWFETLYSIDKKDPEEILAILSNIDPNVKKYLQHRDRDCVINRVNIKLTIEGLTKEIERIKKL